MDLKEISKSVRYGTESEGFKLEASVTTNNGKLRIDSGKVYDKQTGAWLAGFAVNGESRTCNFVHASDRAKRTALMNVIEDFIAELSTENETTDENVD